MFLAESSIQITFLPNSSYAMHSDYVKGERTVLNDNESVESAWKGYAVCNEAIVDPNNAWVEAQNLISSQLDPGLSKSQVLFWVSTREGFLSSTTAELSPGLSDLINDDDEEVQTSSTSPGNPINAPKSNTKSLASCSSHEKCVAEGLGGFCCPTSEGVFLTCCS